MGPSGRFTHVGIILDCLGQVNTGFIQVLYLGRAPRTKESLLDFMKWRRVTRHPLVFRGLTGSQRTPGFWGVTFPLPRILPNPKLEKERKICIQGLSKQYSFAS